MRIKVRHIIKYHLRIRKKTHVVLTFCEDQNGAMTTSFSTKARSLVAALRAPMRAGQPLFETTADADLLRQAHELQVMAQLAPRGR